MGRTTRILCLFWAVLIWAPSAHAAGLYNLGAFWRGQYVFTWTSGSLSEQSYGVPVYGTKGTASASNYPGNRSYSSTWTDSSGNLWLFGGLGNDGTGASGFLNDLWEYSGGQWAWISGSSLGDQAGTYGTKGTGSTSNNPGGREAAVSWIDSSGNFWLFSGYGWDGAWNEDLLNDLWEYTPTNSKWTWIGGASTVDQDGIYGTKGTGSTGNIPGARFGATLWKDSSSNLWIFGGNGNDVSGNYGPLNDLWEYAPSTSKWTWVSGSNGQGAYGSYGTKGTGSTSNTPGARDGCASWMDSSGNFWLFGGIGLDKAGNYNDLGDLWEFTSSSTKWTWIDGSSVGASGGSYGTKGTGSTSNIPGARQFPMSWIDSSGTFWLFGGDGVDGVGSAGGLDDTWSFSSSNSKWTWVGGSNTANQNPVWGTLGTASSSNIPLATMAAPAWKDGSGSFWILGGVAETNYYAFYSNAIEVADSFWEFSPTSSQWTWQAGTNFGHAAVYGTKGTASASNLPGARTSPLTWSDSSGNLWLFGGGGYDSSGNLGDLNDLWKYSPTSSQWTWVGGSSSPDAGGTYGTEGTGSTSNIPGAREWSNTWTDSSGNFWLFGGVAEDSTGTLGHENDLWEYNPTNSQWTWVAGSNRVNASGTYGTEGTGSTSNIPGARNGQSSWKDSSGNFWLFGGGGFDGSGNDGEMDDLWEFNPTSKQWTWTSGASTANQTGVYGTKGTGSTSNIPGGREGAFNSIDSSGNLWLFGGVGYDGAGNTGNLNDLWKYNPTSKQWTWVSGASTFGASGTYGTLRKGSTSNTPGARQYSVSWTDAGGNFWLFGGYGYDSAGDLDVLNDLWEFTPASSQWTWVAGSSLVNQSDFSEGISITHPLNIPGARGSSGGWVDSSGNFWLFGGGGYDSTGTFGYLNDLWKLR